MVRGVFAAILLQQFLIHIVILAILNWFALRLKYIQVKLFEKLVWFFVLSALCQEVITKELFKNRLMSLVKVLGRCVNFSTFENTVITKSIQVINTL